MPNKRSGKVLGAGSSINSFQRPFQTFTFDFSTASFAFDVAAFVANETRSADDPVVVLIAEADQVVLIADQINRIKDPTPLWIIGSVGLHLKKSSGWRKAFHGGLLVEPHMPELNDFKKYFVRALRVRVVSRNLTNLNQEKLIVTNHKNDFFKSL